MADQPPLAQPALTAAAAAADGVAGVAGRDDVNAAVRRTVDILRQADACAADLLLAAHEGQLSEVQELLQQQQQQQQDTPPGTCELPGWGVTSLLHCAVWAGSTAAVQCLLDAAVHTEVRDARGDTPLGLAAVTGDTAVAEALIQAGADVNAVNKEKTPVLWRAASNEGMVQQLIAAGASADAALEYADACDTAQLPSEIAAACMLLRKHAASITQLQQTQRPQGQQQQRLDRPNSNAAGNEWTTLLHLDLEMLAVQALRQKADGPDSQQPLLKAVLTRDLSALQEQLATTPASVTAVDSNGCTALHLAVAAQFTKGVLALLAAGAHLNAANNLGQTSMHIAAMLQQPQDAIAALKQAGGVTTAADAAGNTPMHLATAQAVVHGRVKAMQAFIAAGVAVNATNGTGHTSLHFAAQGQHHLLPLQLLLQSGATADARDLRGNTPLHLAVLCSAEAVQLLLAAGADPNAVNKAGDSVLAVAVKGRRLHISQLLLAAGADVNGGIESSSSSSSSGSAGPESILEAAVALRGPQRWPLVVALYEAGAAGHTSLQTFVQAAAEGQVAVIQHLITPAALAGAGEAAVRAAAKGGHIETVQALLAAGVRVDQYNQHSDGPLALAAGSGSVQLVQLLAEAGAGVSGTEQGRGALVQAAAHGHLEVVDWLLQQGGQPNTWDGLQLDEVLAAAAERNHSDVVRLLMTNPYARVTPGRQQGMDLLRHAVQHKHDRVVYVLLECLRAGHVISEADLNPSSHQESLLAAAIAAKHPGIVAALIAAGAHVNPVGWQLSPLALAARYLPGAYEPYGRQTDQVLAILLRHKARTSASLYIGNDALQFAVPKYNNHAVRLLLSELDPDQLPTVGQINQLIDGIEGQAPGAAITYDRLEMLVTLYTDMARRFPDTATRAAQAIKQAAADAGLNRRDTTLKLLNSWASCMLEAETQLAAAIKVVKESAARKRETWELLVAMGLRAEEQQQQEQQHQQQ